MHIKDNLHGMLYFNEEEREIIDSPEFQRLRKVKQLAMAHLIYPGAMHTRYAHSLGTAYLAEQMALALERTGIDVDVKLARIKGLVHDIGHSAFSHTGENVLKKFVGNHEKVKEQKIKRIMENIHNYSYKEIIGNNKEEEIIAGEIGADRMDYLLRDALHTGVAYGIVDWERIVSKIIDIDTVEENALESVEALLIARFLMFSTVYQHDTVRVASEMLEEGLRRAIDEGLDYNEVLERGDDEVLMMMEQYEGSREIAKELQRRDLWYIIDEREEGTKEEIIEEYRKKGREVLVSLPDLKQKEFKVYIGKDKELIGEKSMFMKALNVEKKRKKILVIERIKTKKPQRKIKEYNQNSPDSL